jgi:DNA-binding NarL/FixJ family response regulator
MAIEAYKKAGEAGQPYDFVIMDLTIPGGMGGKEAVLELRKSYPEAKVLVSSGYSDDPVVSEHKEHGFDGVLCKPYKLEELSNTLKALAK